MPTDIFLRYLQQELKPHSVVSEFRFHSTRRWRFDYALPVCRVAIEIDGGVWTYGRHNRASGYLKDLEKMNSAAALGWRVLHFTPQERYKTGTLDTIKKAILAKC